MLSACAFSSADSTYLNVDNSRYHKTPSNNLFIMFLRKISFTSLYTIYTSPPSSCSLPSQEKKLSSVKKKINPLLPCMNN